MPDHPMVEIRSYRAVFDFERRLYRIDRLRLNPSGVPVRGLVFLVVGVLAIVVAQRLPVVGWPVRALPWQLRYALLPAGAAALLTVVRIDGRPAHTAVVSIARFALWPRHLSAFARCPRPGACWTPARLAVICDDRPPLRFRGPGAVMIGGPHRLARRGRRLVLTLDRARRSDAPRRVLVVRRRATLVVTPPQRR